MLHLVFSDNGLERIHELLRPTDQVVQFCGDRILLVDIAKYLKQPSPEVENLATLEGKEIDHKVLANLIESAQSIKSTY